MSQQKLDDNDTVQDTEPALASAANEGADNEPPEKAAADALPDPSSLQTELERAQAKAEEYWNQYLAAKAETENLRKRSERELANAHKFALEKFIGELLPVKDSIELGISAAADTTDVEKLKEGNELTLKMMATVLSKFGVEEVDPKGHKFNPELHEAMAMQPSAEAEPNTVLQVVQKGYLLNQRLVRPAMVIVAQAVS